MFRYMEKPVSQSTNEEPTAWNAVYTRHQHEKSVADSLTRSGFEVFLPTYKVVRRRVDRKKQLSLPLFPCYVFLRSTFERRLQVLGTPGVRSVVSFASRPALIPNPEIDAIRKAVESKFGVEPHPFLECGSRVRVRSGPLADVEGILVRKKSSHRLILSAKLLGKSIAVELDASTVESLHKSPRPTGTSQTTVLRHALMA
jgi:transcription antitermination factor NusG